MLHKTKCDVNKLLFLCIRLICKQVLFLVVIVHENYPNKVYVKEVVVSNDYIQRRTVSLCEHVATCD